MLNGPHREACCLSGAQLQDITRRLIKLIQASNDCPLLIVKICSDEVVKKDTSAI